jgi:integrase
MPRQRTANKHLPRNMVKRGPSYYFVTSGNYTNLGRDYPKALIAYAGLVGETPELGTVADLLAAYIETRRATLSPITIEGYLYGSRNLGAVFGHLPLASVMRSDVYRYVKQVGNVQANRDRALLSAAYTFAKNIGAFTGDNPAMGLQERNTEKPRVRYMDDAEYSCLLAESSPRLACMIRFLYLTGMRPSDAFALRHSDFDDQGFLFTTSKTGKLAGVQWSDDLRAVVLDARNLFRRFGRVYLFESAPKGQHAARGAGQYTVSGFRSLFKRAAARAGLVDIRPYDLRKKAGSDVTEAHATHLLGHSDAKTTRRHYRTKIERAKPVK